VENDAQKRGRRREKAPAGQKPAQPGDSGTPPPAVDAQPKPAAVTIEPETNNLTLQPAEVLQETLTVTIPRNIGRERKDIQQVKLVPSAAITPFVTAITPGSYGPLAGDVAHMLTFAVTFTGIACTAQIQSASGTLDVVADDAVVAQKRARISVPACAERGFVYAVKFVCGEQPADSCGCTPLQPGRYATQVNITNPNFKEVELHKRFIPLVLAGAALGREPRVAAPRAEDKLILPPHNATMDDCCRISELLLGGPGSAAAPLTLGWLEISASAELSVTAVYTTSSLNPSGVAIKVEAITGQRA
jgi:hypothetical protein